MLTFFVLFCIISFRVPGSLPPSGRSSLEPHTDWIFLWILAFRYEGFLFPCALMLEAERQFTNCSMSSLGVCFVCCRVS